MQLPTCPICNTGKLHPKIDAIAVTHGLKEAKIDSHYSICDGCGSEQASAAEVALNKVTMDNFRASA